MGTVPAFKRLLAGTHKFYFFGFFNTFYQKKNLPLKKIYGYLPLKGYWQVPINFIFFGFLTLFTKKIFTLKIKLWVPAFKRLLAGTHKFIYFFYFSNTFYPYFFVF